MASTKSLFPCVKTEGAILPAELLHRIVIGDSNVPGLKAENYHLAKTERLNESATRAWNRMKAVWTGFRDVMETLPEDAVGTSETRERWLLILFQELGYGRLQTAKAVEIENKSYAISHQWGLHVPLHLVSFRQDLDSRTRGRAGASRVSPHSLMQEFLNRSDSHLWAFVSNGQKLRILRDNVSLTRVAYVEFDLQAMMDGDIYSDFFLLFLLCHQSRVEVPVSEGGKSLSPEHCWLEKWYNAAAAEGVRALDQLREGVELAIETLGGGFLGYPGNTALRDKLRQGNLTAQDYYRQVLRQVYRLIFLFVAEDRDLLLKPDVSEEVKTRYYRYYSTQRLRTLAGKRRVSAHCDLWRQLHLVLAKLHDGCDTLGLPALGSFLFSPEATADLNDCDVSNTDLSKTLFHLSYTTKDKIRQEISFRNLGPEELGSVYESLLEMHPELHSEATDPRDRFRLEVVAGSERKTTGSYYTPSSLVNCLLDSALDPVIEQAIKGKSLVEQEKAVLNLKVCDPACGSGHFLIAAAHRIAKRLAAIRAGEEEPSPTNYQHALREVIGHCIYGVDVNPMSVELCKISLWIEALEPGVPLAFLDHHIQCGNSLLGTTPALMKRGIPDDAFKPIEGDDKAICRELKKRNKDERQGQGLFLFEPLPWLKLGNLVQSFANLSEEDDSTPEALAAKEQHYVDLVRSAPYENARLIADAWCAAFVCEKRFKAPLEITERIFRQWEDNPHHLGIEEREELQKLRDHYSFFHWHLTFPEVFRPKPDDQIEKDELTGWNGGFDCMLGNPPWERIKLQEKEFFAALDPEIANAPSAAKRRERIKSLQDENPQLLAEFEQAKRKAEGESHLVRDDGMYPLCGRGDVNTYAIFAELKRRLLSRSGRVGCIVPSGIATDDTTKFFFQDLMHAESLVSLYDFENRKVFFPSVDSRMRFCILTMAASASTMGCSADFVFFAHSVADLAERDRHFALSSHDIRLLNPNTRTCPIFRSKRDAELTKLLQKAFPAFASQTGAGEWCPTFFKKMIDFGVHADLVAFSPNAPGPNWVGVYEAKMVFHYDHRASTYAETSEEDQRKGRARGFSEQEHGDPCCYIAPRAWVETETFANRMANRNWERNWFLSYRDVTNSTNMRTAVFGVRPRMPAVDKLPSLFVEANAAEASCLIASLSSFALDFVARQKVGGTNMGSYIVGQLPVISSKTYRIADAIDGVEWEVWLRNRAIELVYTAWDLLPFAADCGFDGPPFIWDRDRRFLIQSELHAAFFRFYLGSESDWLESGSKELLDYFPTPRHAVEYIMETFPIVKRKDEKAHGCYRTKDTVLEVYDKMAEAIRTGQPYQTLLDPPPGPPTDVQGNFIPVARWDRDNWPPHIHLPREDEIPTIEVVGVQPSIRQIEEGVAVLYALALLYTWKKAVERRAFELGMMLMQRDDLCERIVKRQHVAKQGSVDVTVRVGNMDAFLGELVGSGSLAVEDIESRQLIKLGASAPAREQLLANSFGSETFAKAEQAVRAVAILAEQGQSLHLYMEAEDHDTVEIAIT